MRRGGRPLEPWYVIGKNLALPPFKLWFNWRFEGFERIPAQGPLIVAGNHLSFVDPFAHGLFVTKAGRRPRFLAKVELFKNPILRTVLKGAGQIPVARGTGDQTPLEDAQRALATGEVVVIYPEGTTTATNPDFSPARGKTGAVRLALAAGVPILPVATYGGQYVMRHEGKTSLKFGRPILLKAGEPMDLAARAEGADDAETLRRLTDEMMAELGALVADLRARYPKRWAQG